MIASIPSPSFNSIEIGPFSLTIYGLLIAIGVIAAVWLMGHRFEQRGVGTMDDASAVALWAVFAGVLGARAYHVITDWHRYDDDLAGIITGFGTGLGIPGGLIVGIPVGLYVAHRRGISPGVTATCAAPAIPLAQAIGRWGNYFNQELYGRPTDLPWGLEIDAEHLESGYDVGTTFHPTFLYESMWNLGLVGVLLWIDRRFSLRNGSLMAIYVMGYGIGRFWVEGLRIDAAPEVAGLRWNQWMALAMIVGGGLVLAYLETRPKPAAADPEPALPDDTPVANPTPDFDDDISDALMSDEGTVADDVDVDDTADADDEATGEAAVSADTAALNAPATDEGDGETGESTESADTAALNAPADDVTGDPDARRD